MNKSLIRTVSLSVVTIILLLATAFFTLYIVIPDFNAHDAPSGFYIYTVQKGDTLYIIGHKVGVPWEFIADANNIAAPFGVRSGETLLIPEEDPDCGATNETFTSPGNFSSYSSNSTKYVIIRFDDSFQNQWSNALPILLKYGFHAVYAVVTGFLLNITLCPPAYYYERMTWQEVQWLHQNGNEISDHTYSHAHLGEESMAGLQVEVQYSLTMLHQHGISDVDSLTLPFGNGYNNETVLNYISQSGFKYIYPDDQDSFAGIINYSYPGVTMKWYAIDALDNESFANFQSIVNSASASNIVGLMFHNVADNVPNSGYYVNTTNFAQDTAYLYQNNFNVILPTDLPGY